MTKPGETPPRLSRRKKAIFAAVTLAVILVSAETVLRLHDFSFYFNFGADLLGMPLLDLHSIRRVQNRTVEFDPFLFWRFKPNQTLTGHGIYRKDVTINAHGFRGPGFQDDKPGGVYRIVCIGDSTTFGWSVGDDDAFCDQLGGLAASHCPGKKIEAINLGVTGYTSHQGRRLLEHQAAEWAPDLVIFAFGPNDRLPALKSDREHEATRTWDIGAVSVFLSRFQLYKLAKAAVVYVGNRARGLSLDPATYISRLKRKVSPDEFADNVRAVKERCDTIGAELVLVHVDYPSLPPDHVDAEVRKQAVEHGVEPPPEWRPWLGSEAAALAEDLGIPFLDLRPFFERKLMMIADGELEVPVPMKDRCDITGAEPWRCLMIDNGHPNEWGHALIAEELLRMISGLSEFSSACEAAP